MVNELSEGHAADWDVFLPAKVFALCFQERPSGGQRPFSLLCCSGAEPVREPRGLHVGVNVVFVPLIRRTQAKHDACSLRSTVDSLTDPRERFRGQIKTLKSTL